MFLKYIVPTLGLLLAAIPIYQWLEERLDRDFERKAAVIEAFLSCSEPRLFPEYSISYDEISLISSVPELNLEEGFSVARFDLEIGSDDLAKMWKRLCDEMVLNLAAQSGIGFKSEIPINSN